MENGTQRRKKVVVLIVLAACLLVLLIFLAVPGWLKSRVYTGPQDTEKREVTYLEDIIFEPLVVVYDEAVDLFRLSNFRNFDWPGFGCLFLPHNPQQIPGKWFRNVTSYCYQ